MDDGHGDDPFGHFENDPNMFLINIPKPRTRTSINPNCELNI